MSYINSIYLLALMFIMKKNENLCEGRSNGCDRLMALKRQVDKGKSLSYVGSECTGMSLPESVSKKQLIGNLSALLHPQNSMIQASVTDLKTMLSKTASGSPSVKARTNQFLSGILPEEPSTLTYQYFYEVQVAFATAVHRVRWEMVHHQLLVELGQAPTDLQDQQVAESLKKQAHTQEYYLQRFACYLRTLAGLESDASVTTPTRQNSADWDGLWKCGDHVLDPKCMARNKVIVIKLGKLLQKLYDFVSESDS